jgi:hypothetical protein
MSEATRDRIVSALAAEESALRDEGVGLIVDHVLGQKLRDLVDLEGSRAIVVRALTPENLARIVGLHVKPGWRRYAEHVQGSGETLGAFVPEPSREKIRRIVGKSKLPRGKWAQGIVDPVLMRRLFAPVWANLLLNFAKRLPVPGMGGASGAASAAGGAVGRGVGGIAGRLTRSVQERAEKLVDAGRTVMGGLGAEVEKRLQAAAREFSDGAADMWREALQDRLKSAEGRELVAQITGQVVDHLMMTKLSDLHEDAARLPIEDMIDLVPGIVGHSAPRAFVQEIVSGELAAFLAVEGDRTLSELLGEMGILEEVRAATVTQIGRIARGLFASPAFGSWIGRLLEA